MESKISFVEGRAVAVAGDDVDTDRIMPARYLRCVTFADIGQYTFQDERFDAQGKPKAHPFNDPAFQGASILVVNKNFGCGSSREHAPQGILRWGIQAIIGESFAEIFAGNCTSIGLPVVTASEADVRGLQTAVLSKSAGVVRLDLEGKKVTYGGTSFAVDMRESSRSMFLDGTWDSSATLLSALPAVKKRALDLPYMAWGGR